MCGCVFIFLVVWMVYSVEHEVEMAMVQQGAVQEYLKCEGVVKLQEYQALYSPYQGLVRQILVAEGEAVAPGQKILQIEVANWQEILKNAEIEYREARERLKMLRGNNEPPELQMGRTLLEQARVTEDAALNQFNQQSDMFRQLSQAGGKKTGIKEQEQLLRIADNVLREARRQTQTARSNLELLKKAFDSPEVMEAETSLEKALENLNRLRETPGKTWVSFGINGSLISRRVDVCKAVNKGDLLAEAGATQTAYIRIGIKPSQLSRCKLGQTVQISGPALNENVIEGKVSYIASPEDQQHSLECRIDYDKSHYLLKPESKLTVKLITMAVDRTVNVPSRAILNQAGRSYVFVVESGSRIFLREVLTGLRNADVVEIKRGLLAGEQVVVAPGLGLTSGARVTKRTGL